MYERYLNNTRPHRQDRIEPILPMHEEAPPIRQRCEEPERNLRIERDGDAQLPVVHGQFVCGGDVDGAGGLED